MTVPRSQLVDLETTRYYHCISRCVRRAMLCGEGYEHRRQWIEDRLEWLADSFAIAVCGFAVMGNHLHILTRLDSELTQDWTDEDVVRRWARVYPPKTPVGDEIEITQAWLDRELSDAARVQSRRERLGDLGWFMKAIKEPLARMANKEDGCKGTFWESRYKSIAILDEEALLAACAYIDLNPVAAGLAATPEASRHTSIRSRIQYVKSQGALEALKSAKAGSVQGCRSVGDLEQGHWLCPVDDRRSFGMEREGLLEGLSLGGYLLLVDYTSRICRTGKARVSGEMAGIFERLGTTGEVWGHRMLRLFSKERLLGNFFAADPQSIRELAAKRGVHHLDNVAGHAVA